MTETLPNDLLRRDAYPFEASRVELVETHISWVFLVGDRVFKVKKPLRLAFLDYSTPDLRRFFCEEELRLNRRLAPGVYLRVAPLTREPRGRLRVDGDGPIVDWAVEMVRLPDHRMLDRLLERSEIDNEALERVARLLVDFHRREPRDAAVDAHGSPAAVGSLVDENFDQLAAFAGTGRPLSERLTAFLEARARRFLARHRDLLERRVEEGRIRDGHGDLHAGNLCFTDDGVVAYDSLEFSARFRCGDQALDLAFLAMDLDFRGFHAFSDYLCHRYADLADDPELPAVLPFYKGYRATVRSKVRCLAADGADDPAAERLAARAYLHLAVSYELPPCLVLTCGPPATGKSWAARALARRWGAAWLRSDVRRKSLAGLPPTGRVPPDRRRDLYSRRMTERTYASLLAKTARAIDEGRSAVVDAMFSRRQQRRPFLALAADRSLPVYLLRLEADEDEIRRRLEIRRTDPGDPSDADLAVYLEARDAFEAPTELPPSRRIAFDTSGADVEDVIAAVTERRIAVETSHSRG